MMTRVEQIAAALSAVRKEIAEAERSAGRPAGTVRLIAVSKKIPSADIRAAIAAGQVDFGENYAQELRDKRAELSEALENDVGQDVGQAPDHAAGTPLRWHLIGPLQTNKVKYVAGQVAMIHTVDRLELLREIDRRAAALGVEQSCLVQVNVAGEAQKHGVSPAALAPLLDAFAEATHVTCDGLMLIPPVVESPAEGRRHLAALRTLAERESQRQRPRVTLRELSMGMSADFADAIAEGATLVRVGTAIFGARPTPIRPA
jgi:pyridoxal phosphate enzyme (YggS family)